MQKVSRFYESFQPTSYDIYLDISKRVEREFRGRVNITGQQTGRVLDLHAKDLNIVSVRVNGNNTDYQLDGDELKITSTEPGEKQIEIEFDGKISPTLHGMYPSSYDIDGEKRELLVTQFESHHAREVFPCVDEPEAKAEFILTLETEDNQTVLSNMPAVSSHPTENGTLTTRFAASPRMSSYLLAFVVGDLIHKTTQTKSGVDVSVYATPNQPVESLDFALDHAARTIEYFDEYFGVPYPLPKSDHVALPDFSSGAMENWGLITYREVALLADPRVASLESKQYIATVIAHELSHQWFGNLVTMRWWNNLWLNESFASIMEYMAPDHMHPDWNIWLDFITNDAVAALRRDAIDGVQSVQTPVNHPDEINTLFDGAIVYAKGARLMQMLEKYVGSENFRKGLGQYFYKHQYGNTEETDLWKALAETSGKDITGFMTAWISQPGYPVVSVTKTDSGYALSQRQFYIGPNAPAGRLWPIPLDSSHPDMPEIFDTETLEITSSLDDLLILNENASGHYIVHYDDTLRSRIINSIQNGELSVVQRAEFLNEQILLARADILKPAALLEILSVYKNEENESVWEIIALATGELKKFVENDREAESKLRRFVGSISRTEFTRLGWDKKPDDSYQDQKLRPRIIGNMIYSEDQTVIDEAIKRFHASSLEDLDPELRSLIITAAVRYENTPDLIENLLKTYRTTPSAELRGDIRSGLTSTKDSEVISKLIDLLKDENTIRPQDVTHWVIYLLMNRESRAGTWQWLQDSWSWIEEKFASDKSYDYFPRYAGQLLTRRVHMDQYREFFTPMLQNPSLARIIEMGLLDLEGRIDLIERESPAVCVALKNL